MYCRTSGLRASGWREAWLSWAVRSESLSMMIRHGQGHGGTVTVIRVYASVSGLTGPAVKVVRSSR